MTNNNVKIGKLSDFRPAAKNSNKHTTKGLKALDNSMSQDGYVAPMTSTADGEILDGSARLERAFERFNDEAIIVHHDGSKPVIMVRDDIPNADDPLARRVHYRANTVQWQDFELDPEVVMADIEAGFDFEKIDLSLEDLADMMEDGIEKILMTHPDFQPQEEDSQPQLDQKKPIICPHCGKNIHDGSETKIDG